VARAKRTDRAEARRQYRAYLAAEQAKAAAAAAEAEDEAEAEPETAPGHGRWTFPRMQRPSPSTQTSARPASGSSQTKQPGIFGSFTGAIRPVHYGEDLRYAPTLITRTHAVWPPAAMCLLAVVVVLASTDQMLLGIALLIVTPYPLLTAMVAGFLAPKASWLAGAIAGILSGASFSFVLLVAENRLSTDPAAQSTLGANLPAWIVQSILYGAFFGVAVGAVSAWYKRFLSTAFQPKPRQSQSKSRQSQRNRQSRSGQAARSSRSGR
jgi:hypothetical protein